MCVCICTFKRPELLGRLLAKLQTLETEDLFDYSIVIVDNDQTESARQTVQSWKQQSHIALAYYVEPEQNIARARNKAVENAKGDYISFIDDDEYPDEHWLLNLYKALMWHQTDGVLGPVLPHFEAEPPTWVMKGHFFDRPMHQTGHVLEWKECRTGNVLLKRTVFTESGEWFDPKLGSGGEDRDFFRKKIQQGFTFIWCNEAPVFESIPARRWNRVVLLKRAFLRGKMALYAAKSKPPTVLRSLAAIFAYTLFLPFLFILGHHLFMRYLVKDFDHIGKVMTFIGFDFVKEKYVIS